MLDKFVSAIESIDMPNKSDRNWNNKDFGFVTYHMYGTTN